MNSTAVGAKQRVTDWLHLHLAASYRLASGAEQPPRRSTIRWGRFVLGPMTSARVGPQSPPEAK